MRAVEPVDGKLQCRICGEWKPLEKLQKSKVSKYGRMRRCGACSSKELMVRYSQSPEKFLHFIGTGLYRSSKQFGAKSKRSAESFSREMLTGPKLMALWESQGGRCAWTGLEMTHVLGAGRQWRNASIDRIDPSKGYEDGNVRLVCVAVNLMRREMNDDEFLAWAKLVVRSGKPL